MHGNTWSVTLGFPMLSLVLLAMLTIVRPLAAQEKEDSAQQNLTRQVTVQEGDKYLNLPIRGWSGDAQGEETMMRIVHEGEVLDEFQINLSQEPDWWGFFQVEQYQGDNLKLEVEDSSRKEGLEMVVAEPEIKNQEDLYKERYRQQVHFSNKRGWNNDPNGMIYYNGKWHLFFQYNPYGWNWGNMHWGHAVSDDLVHWQELRPALYSPDHDHMAFSGGATVDSSNTAGFRRNGVDPLIATYTRTGSGEHLALSYDNGKTFEEYEGNPVLEHEGRDPKVIWYEPDNRWVMIVYDEDPARAREMDDGTQGKLYQHAIYTSENMKDWEYQSSIPTMFECPELFELSVEGEQGVSKWVVYDGDGKYYVGEFNGEEFKSEQSLKEFDHGGEFYASQTFANVPEEDGRRIQIGWFQTTTPYMPFNQSMTFPTKLSLRELNGEYTLTPTPVKGIETLHAESYSAKNISLGDGETFSSPLHGDKLHIVAEIDKGGAFKFGLNINGYELNLNRARAHLNDTFYPIKGNTIKFEIIVDKMSVETFVDDGALYYASQHNSVDNENVFEITPSGGNILIKNLEVHELESIWKNQKHHTTSPARNTNTN